MYSNLTTLLKKAGPYPVILGVTALLTELGSVYIPKLIQKNSVTIVPAEPVIANLDEDEPAQSDETLEDEDVVIMHREFTEEDETEHVEAMVGYEAAAAPYQYQASEYAKEVHAMQQAEEEVEDSDYDEATRTMQQVQSAVNPEAMLVSLADARKFVNYARITSVDGPVEENEVETEDEPVLPEIRNIFELDDNWDMEHELSSRDPEFPYIISSDEYLENATDYKQETVTYYEGDDTMANVADVPIHNWPSMMGQLRWGHGSLDPSVVYVRNERLHREWEILLVKGSFEIEVQGLHIEDGELRHVIRKFRED